MEAGLSSDQWERYHILKVVIKENLNTLYYTAYKKLSLIIEGCNNVRFYR